jgi:hypothetical protein
MDGLTPEGEKALASGSLEILRRTEELYTRLQAATAK